jgi:hypothetical protein
MAVGKLVVWELPVGELAPGDLTAGMFAVYLSWVVAVDLDISVLELCMFFTHTLL